MMGSFIYTGGRGVQSGLLLQGLELMLFGMLAVGLFLALLVLAVQLASQVIARWFPEAAEVSPSSPPVGDAPAGDGEVTPETVAVIAAALHQHRRNHPHRDRSSQSHV